MTTSQDDEAGQDHEAGLLVVPAGTARAVAVRRGGLFDVISPFGAQVADTWAFCADEPEEHLSVEHSRLHSGRLCPSLGETLVSNRRRPMLTLLEDTSGGAHDTLLPACDAHRYQLLGHSGFHRNCVDNLREAAASMGRLLSSTPNPLNLFENVRQDASGGLRIEPPVCPPGGYVRMRAEADLLIVISACPQDLTPTNGADRTPKDIHLRLLA